MKLTVFYDNDQQVIELSSEDVEKFWVSLEIEGAALTQAEKEKRIQEVFNELFNRPEYNNWHRETRRLGRSCAKPAGEKEEKDLNFSEPLVDEVMDPRIFYQDEIKIENDLEYEEICKWVRETLSGKPYWAEAFIAVRMDGMAEKDYAKSVGIKNVANISKYVKQAEKKLRKYYEKRNI